MTKKLIAATLIATLGLSSLLTAAPAAGAASPASVQFRINDKTYTDSRGAHALAAAPFLRNQSTMVPLRALAQSLGAAIAWDPAKQEAIVTGASFGQLTFKENDPYAYGGNNAGTKLSEPPIRIAGMLFVPAKSAAALMGAGVAWEGAARTVTIANKTEAAGSLEYAFDFKDGDQGWTGSFADLPVRYDAKAYDLQFSRELLPLQSNASDYGLKLHGSNRSDDLFMFLSKRIEGLEPNKEYRVKLAFDLYTDESDSMMGIGGAPGEAVTVKAGILGFEPKAVKTEEAGESYYRLNADKGNQTVGGAEIPNLGNVVKPNSSEEGFQRKPFEHEAVAKTNANGELFVLIGTDSGYEGLSTLYFDNVKLVATPR